MILINAFAEYTVGLSKKYDKKASSFQQRLLIVYGKLPGSATDRPELHASPRYSTAQLIQVIGER